MAWLETMRRRAAQFGPRLYWELRDRLSRPERVLESQVVKFRVLFVCFGNICRSPLAEEIFRQKVARVGLGRLVAVDSAGTSADNIGKRPFWQARACAARHGLTLGHPRARLFTPADFRSFDRILVMDQHNRDEVLRLAPAPGNATHVHLLLEFAGGGEIRDPMGGEAADFERVFHQIEAACEALVAHVAGEVARGTGTMAVPAPQ